MVFAGPSSPASTDSDTESVGKAGFCPIFPRMVPAGPSFPASTDSGTETGGTEGKLVMKSWLNSDQLRRKAKRGLLASLSDAPAKNSKVKSDASAAAAGSENGKSPAAAGGADEGPAAAKAGELKMYSLAELMSATRNFRLDTMLEGSEFGRVFKGWVDEKTLAPVKVGSGMPVAVKKSNPDSGQGLREWQSEVEFLGEFSHPNLVRLVGYCWDDKQYLLVYEFMQRGSLENHLFRRGAEPLPWDVRLKIAIGAARGLDFLHKSEKNVIYGDFKSSNILLDADYNAKLSDFRAKLGPTGGNSPVTTQVIGTYGYAAPEYNTNGYAAPECIRYGYAAPDSPETMRVIGTYGYAAPKYITYGYAAPEYITYGYAAPQYTATGHLYVKSDVYSFGVVLLEMLTGLQALDRKRPSGQQNLVAWAMPSLCDKGKLRKIMDARLEGQYPLKAATQAAELILKCLEGDPKARPSMDEVLVALERINNIRERKEAKASTSSQPSSHQHHHNHHRSPIHHNHSADGPRRSGTRHSQSAASRTR